MAHQMSGAAGAAMIAVMTMMMLAMAGFSLRYAARAVPAAWRERIRRAIRAAGRPAATGGEGT
jgi:hypothetical protein